VPPAAPILEQSLPIPEPAVRLPTLPALVYQTNQDFPKSTKINHVEHPIPSKTLEILVCSHPRKISNQPPSNHPMTPQHQPPDSTKIE
jgi:hypothetical protein